MKCKCGKEADTVVLDKQTGKREGYCSDCACILFDTQPERFTDCEDECSMVN